MSKFRDENIPNISYSETCIQQVYYYINILYISLLYQAVGGKLL